MSNELTPNSGLQGSDNYHSHHYEDYTSGQQLRQRSFFSYLPYSVIPEPPPVVDKRQNRYRHQTQPTEKIEQQQFASEFHINIGSTSINLSSGR